jgi:hypothetical protein
MAAQPGTPVQYGLSNGQNGYDKGDHADVMNDLIVMALRCDATRVISYMMEDARSDFVYDHLTERHFDVTGSIEGTGQVGGYHGLQHAGDSNNGFATINWWQSLKISELAQRLDAIEEGDGTLLDHTIIQYGSGMHGSNHDANELPMVLIGGGDGVLTTDQHVVFDPTPNDGQLRDLYYTIANAYFELNIDSFGTHVDGKANALISEMLT